MRRGLVLVAIALAVGAVLYQLLTNQQGFVLLSIGNLVVEMSLWTALLVVLLLLLAISLLRGLWRLLASPRQWLVSRSQRQQYQQRNRTLQGFVDYLAGNWPAAIDKLTKSADQSDLPAANYLGAAAASFQMGDRRAADALLSQAEAAGAADNFATGLLRIQLALQAENYVRAEAEAEQLHRRNPRHPTVLRLLASSRKGLGDWPGLERLLRDLNKHGALSKNEMEALEVEVHGELLAAYLATQPDNLSAAELRTGLDRRWHDLPRHLHRQPRLIAEFVRQLVQLGATKKAETRLAKYLSRQWDPTLVELYGTLPADIERQLSRAESWQGKHPDDPVLLRALGRLCVRAELWGKARDYFERSLAISPDGATYAALAELLFRLDDPEGGLRCYRQGLAVYGHGANRAVQLS